MRLRNLNLYLAWVCIGYLIGVTAPMWSVYSNLMWSLPGDSNLGESPVYLLVVAALPAWVWYRRGLLPRAVLPGRESRQRRGERVVAVSTALFLVGCVGPFLVYRLRLDDELIPYIFLAVPVAAICILLWAGGLYAVYSAARRPANAGTSESEGPRHE